MKNRILLIVALAAAILTLAACASNKSAAGTSASVTPAGINYYTLSNGIQVMVKPNDTNRVQSISILFEGGASQLDPSLAGLEAATISLMARGSETYSFDDLQYIGYATSCSITSGNNRDYSTLSLTCIDKYLDDLLPVYLDCLLNPAFDEEQYELVMNDLFGALQGNLNDPFSLMQYRIIRSAYQNTAYRTETGLTEESYENITLDAIKVHHEELLNARRMTVVAAGNFDEKALVASLEAALGAIPAMPFTRARDSLTALPASIPPVAVETHPSSEGTAFMGQYMTAPACTDDDYMAFAIASDMMSEILFNVVREKHGDCYSIGMGSMGTALAPVGLIYVYRASNYTDIFADIEEAVAIMEKGLIINDKDPVTGDYIFEPLENRLESYKNSLINSTFEGQVTNGGLASKIISSLMYYGDETHYTRSLERIRAVTAADVKAAFEKHYVQNDKHWFIVTGSGDAEAFAGL